MNKLEFVVNIYGENGRLGEHGNDRQVVSPRHADHVTQMMMQRASPALHLFSFDDKRGSCFDRRQFRPALIVQTGSRTSVSAGSRFRRLDMVERCGLWWLANALDEGM